MSLAFFFPDASLETTPARLLSRGVLAGTGKRAVDVLCQGSGSALDGCERAPLFSTRTYAISPTRSHTSSPG